MTSLPLSYSVPWLWIAVAPELKLPLVRFPGCRYLVLYVTLILLHLKKSNVSWTCPLDSSSHVLFMVNFIRKFFILFTLNGNCDMYFWNAKCSHVSLAFRPHQHSSCVVCWQVKGESTSTHIPARQHALPEGQAVCLEDTVSSAHCIHTSPWSALTQGVITAITMFIAADPLVQKTSVILALEGHGCNVWKDQGI